VTWVKTRSSRKAKRWRDKKKIMKNEFGDGKQRTVYEFKPLAGKADLIEI